MRNCHHRNTDEPKPYYLLFIKKKKNPLFTVKCMNLLLLQ